MAKLNERGKRAYHRDMTIPHIGSFIKLLLDEKEFSGSKVAAAMGVTPSAVYFYFKKKSLQAGVLWKMSKVLNYNIFAKLAERIDIPYETKKEKELQQKIEQMQRELQDKELIINTLLKVSGKGNSL